MRRTRLVLWFALLAPACVVYDPSLLENDGDGASGGKRSSGGSASGGKQSSNGGSSSGGASSGGFTSSGGRAGGGAPSGGTSTGGRASGGESADTGGSLGTGGEDTASGGKSSGGSDSSGGAPTGGKSSGGGAMTGGNSSGGSSTGGSSSGGGASGGSSTGGNASGGSASGGTPGLGGTGPWLIDDLSTGDSYSRSIFSGYWERYEEPGATWAEASVLDMVQPRPDDVANEGLHVEASMLNEWGVDLRITLNGGTDFLNLTPYTGIKVSAHTLIASETKIRVAIEDSVSNYNSCATTSCDKHIEFSNLSSISSTAFTVVTLPFAQFTSKPSPRTLQLDLSKVYAIHVKMDPSGSAVDFFIDDIYLY